MKPNKYELFYEHLARGAIIRSRANWYEQGEKSNKCFLNLETHKISKSSIRKAYTKDGFLTSDPKRIMKEVEDFYSGLYKKVNLKGQMMMMSLIHLYSLENSPSYLRKMLLGVRGD